MIVKIYTLNRPEIRFDELFLLEGFARLVCCLSGKRRFAAKLVREFSEARNMYPLSHPNAGFILSIVESVEACRDKNPTGLELHYIQGNAEFKWQADDGGGSVSLSRKSENGLPKEWQLSLIADECLLKTIDQSSIPELFSTARWLTQEGNGGLMQNFDNCINRAQSP